MSRRHGIATVLAISDDYPLIADPTSDFCYLRLQTSSADEVSGYDAASLETWRSRLQDLAAGRPAQGLPLIGEPPTSGPRDCFVYMIAGAKEKNPVAAQALLAALGAMRWVDEMAARRSGHGFGERRSEGRRRFV